MVSYRTWISYISITFLTGLALNRNFFSPLDGVKADGSAAAYATNNIMNHQNTLVLLYCAPFALIFISLIAYVLIKRFQWCKIYGAKKPAPKQHHNNNMFVHRHLLKNTPSVANNTCANKECGKTIGGGSISKLETTPMLSKF